MSDDVITRDENGDLAVRTVTATEGGTAASMTTCTRARPTVNVHCALWAEMGGENIYLYLAEY